jgi:dipeptidyl-peptidase-4
MTFSTAHQAFDLYKERLDTLVRDFMFLPVWSPDGKDLAYLEGPAERRTGWLVDLGTGERSPLCDVEKARSAVAAATGQVPRGDGLPFAHFGFADLRTIVFAVDEQQVLLDLDEHRATLLPRARPLDEHFGYSEAARRTPRQFQRSVPLMDPAPAHEVVSPDGKHLLSTRDHDVVVRSTYDGTERRLTTDGTPDHEWRFALTDPRLAVLGMAVPTANWSPDGLRVAAMRTDWSRVAKAPKVLGLTRGTKIISRAGAEAGGVLERTTLHVLDVLGRPAVDIDLGDTTDSYPVHAAWLPDSAGLVVFVMSRDCRHIRVLHADARTGRTRLVFEERGDTFLRVHHDVYFGSKLGLWLTPDGSQLLWLSDRTGWMHLYVYDLDGTERRPLTSGEWPVDEVVGIRDGSVYLTGRHDQARPYDVHLYRVPLAGGPLEPLTHEPGVHTAVLAPAADVFIDTWSTPAEPPRTQLRALDGTILCQLSTTDIDPLVETGWQPPRQFTVKAADGETDLWGVMFLPPHFDPEQSYPVVEWVYGGPQIAVAPHSFTTPASPFGVPALALAQLGCVAVVLDARGTPGRSKAFHDAVYGQWANCLADDHAGAILQLAEQFPFVDASRVAVAGFSWGGYSSMRCAIDRPDVYKAAVPMASGFDPMSSLLYECYLGLPQDNPQGYTFADCVSRAAQLTRPLMMICGTSDYTSWADNLRMTEALIRAGKDHEFVVMPEQGHGYDGPHDSYVWRKVQAFLSEHIGTAT